MASTSPPTCVVKPPAMALGLVGTGLVTAMIDISDGLLADYGHIAEQSGVGGSINIDDLPLSATFIEYSAALPVVPYQLVLSGGEDYELCFTANSANRENIVDCAKKCGIEVTRVGIVSSCSGVAAVYRDGSTYVVQADGFNHFK